MGRQSRCRSHWSRASPGERREPPVQGWRVDRFRVAVLFAQPSTAIALGATAGTTARYYPSLDDQIIRREYGTVGTSVVLGAGFTAQADAVYQPYNLRSMMPTLFEPRLGDPSIVDEDFPSSVEHYFGYSAAASDTRDACHRRSTFSAGYNYRGREAGAAKPGVSRAIPQARISATRSVAVSACNSDTATRKHSMDGTAIDSRAMSSTRA